MTDIEAAVTVLDLAKSYGEVEAVRGIDLEVFSGETFGFLGPNEAGKSTTINVRGALEAAVVGLLGATMLGVAIREFSRAE